MTINQLRKLSRAATPGPWSERDAVSDGAGVHSIVWAPPNGPRPDGIVADTGRFPDLQAKADARFIIAAVNYVRSLVER